MTLDKRVEEIVNAFRDINKSALGYPKNIEDAHADWLRTTLTQYHQDLMREVVGKLEIEKRKHNCPPDDGNDYDHGAYVALTEAQNIIKSK